MPAPDLSLAAIQFEPEAPSDGKPAAVFVLHGRRADEHQLLSTVEELPDELHVVCLRAPHMLSKENADMSESDARDIVPRGTGTLAWYKPETKPSDERRARPRTDHLKESCRKVAQSVDAAVEALDLDPARVGLLGFGQGAVVGFTLLCDAPDRFAWVVALNGYLPDLELTESPSGLRDTPVFVSAGREDHLVPGARSKAAAERLRELGADVTFEMYESLHTVGPQEQDDVVSFVEQQLDQNWTENGDA
jgi:phospholipase/carboxylesterase